LPAAAANRGNASKLRERTNLANSATSANRYRVQGLQHHANRLTYNAPTSATTCWHSTSPAIAATAAANNKQGQR
jgi:hypothetical protein